MKKIKKEGLSQAQKNKKLYEVYCPACGQLVDKVKEKKQPEQLAFVCKKCTAKFTLTFPGTDDSDDSRPRGL